MTASELIRELEKYPPDVRIVVAGYESGFDDIETIKEISVKIYPKKQEWDGKYEKSKSSSAMKFIALLSDRMYSDT